MWSCRLAIESAELGLVQLEELIGHASESGSHSRGDVVRSARRDKRYPTSVWLKHLLSGEEGIASLSETVEGLDKALVIGAARAAGAGSDVMLYLTQEIEREALAPSFALSVTAMSVLARMKASIDIDQLA